MSFTLRGEINDDARQNGRVLSARHGLVGAAHAGGEATIAVLVGAALLARLAAMPRWQAWARRYAQRADA